MKVVLQLEPAYNVLLHRDAGEKEGQGGRQEQKGTYYLRPTNIPKKWRASKTLLGNIMGYASHSHINDYLYQSNIACF